MHLFTRAIAMLTEFIERLFHRPQDSSSRLAAKNRLKLVIAHDRSDISPELFEAMQKEILEVVSRYVETDVEGLEFSLQSSQRTTTLVANLPIRRVREKLSSLTASSPEAGSTEDPKPTEASLEQSAEQSAEQSPNFPSESSTESPSET